MKTVVFAGVVTMTLAATGFAGIGEDEKQIETRYGKAGKDLGGHGEVHDVGYVSNGFMIVVSFVNGVSQREGFTKPDTSPMSDQNIKDILGISAAEGTSWQEGQAQGGDKMWNRSDKKAVAIFPSMGKFLFVQDVNFVQPK
ncbi:MAG TPA: hypothetical protein VNX27_09610 [Chthoniobacterales bacterium]|jgi:hypothetical protein|nr:hypothetical protein [Chthoniobacterales bacterium]